jgi:hypothetical protein
MPTRPLTASLRPVLVVLALAGGAGPVWAQAGPDDPQKPRGPVSETVRDAEEASGEAIDAAEVILPGGAGGVPERGVTPPPSATPPRPGLTAGLPLDPALQDAGLSVPPARLLPERAFLNRRTGMVIRGPNETWVFVPARDERTPGEGPMVLAPCRTLERLVSSIAPSEKAPRFVLSGEVLMYDGRNHLLPTNFAKGPAEPHDPEEVEKELEEQAGKAPRPLDATPEIPDELADDPEVAAIIADLDARRSRNAATPSDPEARLRQLDRNRPDARAGAGGKGGGGLVPEGDYLVQRRARLVRASDGRWAVAFDNDTEGAGESGRPTTAAGRTIPDVPMVLIPCSLLARMEITAERYGDNQPVTVSGRVFAYENENFLLPTMFVAERKSEVTPMQ